MTSPNLRFPCVPVVLLALCLLAPVRPAGADTRIDTGPFTTAPQPPPPILPPVAPRGFFLVEEGLWSQHRDQPAIEFQAAQKSLLQKDPASAASSIRRAASYVRAEGSRADAASRGELQAVSNALVALAARLEGGGAADADSLGLVFADAHHAVARHHLALARQAVSEDDAHGAGVQLKSAVDNLRWKLAWSERELDPLDARELDRVDDFATQLLGEGATLDELAGKALDELARLLAL